MTSQWGRDLSNTFPLTVIVLCATEEKDSTFYSACGLGSRSRFRVLWSSVNTKEVDKHVRLCLVARAL